MSAKKVLQLNINNSFNKSEDEKDEKSKKNIICITLWLLNYTKLYQITSVSSCWWAKKCHSLTSCTWDLLICSHISLCDFIYNFVYSCGFYILRLTWQNSVYVAILYCGVKTSTALPPFGHVCHCMLSNFQMFRICMERKCVCDLCSITLMPSTPLVMLCTIKRRHGGNRKSGLQANAAKPPILLIHPWEKQNN